jgi:hypothetical protein
LDEEGRSLSGRCSHLLSGTCWDSDGIDLPGFNVTLTQFGATGHPELSFIRQILIHYHGHNIEIGSDNSLKVFTLTQIYNIAFLSCCLNRLMVL